MNFANIGYDRLCDVGELPDVPINELVPLVKAELGPAYPHAAEPLLRLSGGSILVALVAARLLRTRQLEPDGILHDAEFQTTVLNGFRNEAIGALPGTLDPAAARRLLETLAAVQPIDLEEAELENALARYINVDVSTLRRIVGALVDGGVIRSEDTGSRIVPDVLADHILDGAMVARSRSTTLDAEILTALGARVLVPLLRNVAELDWRRQVAGQVAEVFPGIWSSFSDAFYAAPNWQRLEWLERLHAVAALQPGAMILFAEAFVDDPRGDDRDGRWEGVLAVQTPDVAVVRKIPPLLGLAAQNPDHTITALTQLWRMGRDDVGDIGQQTDHPIRVLTEVVAYSRHRHLWMQESALDALEGWLRDPTWSIHPQSPLVVAKAVLQTAIVEHAFNDRENSVTISRVGIDANNTRDLRLRAIALLEREVIAPSIRGRARALHELLDALRRPDNVLGHTTSIEEEESFRDQYVAVLDAIERVLKEDVDPLTRVSIRGGLHQGARFTLLPWKKKRMQELAQTVTESSATRLVRALGPRFKDWDSELHSFAEYEEQQAAHVRSVVDELVQGHQQPAQLAETLMAISELYDAAETAGEPGPLLHNLAQRYPEIAVDVARRYVQESLTGGDDCPAGLPVLLAGLRHQRRAEYEELLCDMSSAGHAALRRDAAGALARIGDAEARTELELDVSRRLLRDVDISVVRSAIWGLTFAELGQTEQLLAAVELRGDVLAAEQLAEVWAMRSEGQRPRPDERTVQHLLRELTEVPDLGRAQWNIDTLLVSLARLHPVAVVDFLLVRLSRERSDRAARTTVDFGRHYDAIPYQGFSGLQEALRESNGYDAIIERLCVALPSPEDSSEDADGRRENVREVLQFLGQWDEVFERIVRRWLTDGDCVRLLTGAVLFEARPRDFVITQANLIADVLQFVERCGDEIRDIIWRAIERAAFANNYTIRTIGELDPVTLRIASEAEAHATRFSEAGMSAAARFYAGLARLAKEALEREQSWSRVRAT
jgi:hypothetical protein